MTTNIMAMPSIAPGRDLDAYLRTISQFPILKPEEEKVLAERFYADGDIDAARELVMCHLRFSSTSQGRTRAMDSLKQI